jgi:Arf-GAP/GTPase/ANK repeat/PH domain-containing protein 1/3
MIVSLDNKQWNFEAASNEEREEWVQAIEAQILSSLQSNEPNKLKSKNGGFTVDSVTIQTLKNVPGNTQCVDCDAPNPVWASLNHGALICIECSGIHRNLGTHLSRVRSLELDDWSNELIQVMTSIGNKMINSIYESNFQKYPKSKPNPNTQREEKEKWIRAKYEAKQFLANLPNKEITVGKQLLEAVSRQDIPNVILCLAHSRPDDVNSCVSQLDRRTSLHIAASQSSLVILQLLIWYGADVEATDNQGRNALAYARNSNSNECCQLLTHNGCKDIPSNNGTLTRKSNTSISTSHLTNGNTYDKITTYNII